MFAKPSVKPPARIDILTVDDSKDYGGIGLEEFSRRIQNDNDGRYGEIFRGAKWQAVGPAGW